MCQVQPVPMIGVGFEDGSSYYLHWSSSTPGHGQLLAGITDPRNILGCLCSPRLPKYVICWAGRNGSLTNYKYSLNSSGLQEQQRISGLLIYPCCGAGCVDNSTFIKQNGQYDARGRPWYKLGKQRKRYTTSILRQSVVCVWAFLMLRCAGGLTCTRIFKLGTWF